MHNGKSESDYKLNQSSCDRKPMTHVHREKSTSAWEVKEDKRRKQHQTTSRAGNKKKKKKSLVKWIALIVILLNFLPALIMNLIDEFSYQFDDFTNQVDNLDIFTEMEEEYLDDESEYDPYEYLEKELAETGISYQTVLTAGNYIVGVDIPEGQYQAIVLKNQGSLSVSDYENGIYLSEYLDDSDVTQMEDIRLFEGAKLSISGALEAELITENAKSDQLPTLQANPLTDTVSLAPGKYVAGENFPAGTYNLLAVEGYGSIDLMYLDEDGEEYYQDCYYMNADDQEYDPAEVKNVVIPEGYILVVDEITVELQPSERILNEDYASYYNYY